MIVCAFMNMGHLANFSDITLDDKPCFIIAILRIIYTVIISSLVD